MQRLRILLKLLFNIFIVYAIWQLFKMFFSVRKTQRKFHERINDLHGKVHEQADKSVKNKDVRQDGEYIDYEEIN